MKVQLVAKILYGLLGAAFLMTGSIVLLLQTGLLPGAVRDLIVGFGHGDPTTLHVIQEFASLIVFAGLITFWFIRHYEHSKVFHWSMTAFWALFALVHWFNVSGHLSSVRNPAINTIPFVLFLTVGLLRRGS